MQTLALGLYIAGLILPPAAVVAGLAAVLIRSRKADTETVREHNKRAA